MSANDLIVNEGWGEKLREYDIDQALLLVGDSILCTVAYLEEHFNPMKR